MNFRMIKKETIFILDYKVDYKVNCQALYKVNYKVDKILRDK